MSKSLIIVVIIVLVAAGYGIAGKVRKERIIAEVPEAPPTAQNAYFAGGCFWCVESDFEKIPEVAEVVSGYMGGHVENPEYDQVSSGSTGHREVVKVVYDPSVTSYEELVQYLFRHIDPTDAGGSFGDRGHQYTSAIYYNSEEEREIAERVKMELDKSGVFPKPIVTAIEPAGEFYVAEEYHQDYHRKNPIRYNYYRNGSGRNDYIESIWGDMPEPAKSETDDTVEIGNPFWEDYKKPSDEELKGSLTDLQYKVTQKEGTEKPGSSELDANKVDGIYVDILSGEPLFSSTHKYDSGTGWPSFWQPIVTDTVVEKEDRKLFFVRTEIRSKYGDNHIGHVFDDGPEPTGLRYCMNGAALRFVPKADMESEGYSEFLPLFN